MKKKRNVIILLISLSILVVFVVIYAHHQKENHENPFSIDFIPDTMQVRITVSDGYEFEGINSANGNGYLNVPAIDAFVRSVILDVSVIPVGKSDLLTLGAQRADYCIYWTCEILHQSDSQFIVEVSQKATGELSTYKFDY